MKKIYIALFSVLLGSQTFAQTVDIAGTAACTGSIHSFYHDPVDDLLYGIGSVSSAGGQTVSGIVAWNGSNWTAKGDQSMLTGSGLASQTIWNICRNKDTLYAMADKADHSLGAPVGLLMYWDNNSSNWKSKSYGVFGNSYHLVSHNDTLFVVGNISGGLDLSEDVSKYASLGSMAYWNGIKWLKYNTAPSFNSNPNGAVSLNGTLYVDNFKYQNGVWTNLNVTSSGEIKALAAWGNKVVYGVETGAVNEVMMYDGTSVTTLGSFDHVIRSIAQYDGKVAVCGNFDQVSGSAIEEIAIWDGSAWSGVDTSFNGTVTTLGGYHNQLLVSSQEGYPFYDTKKLSSLGSIGLLGGSIQVDVFTVNTSEISVYPNPTTGILFLGNTYESVEILDISGANILVATNTNQIDLSGLSAGTYYLRVNNSDVLPVVKQ